MTVDAPPPAQCTSLDQVREGIDALDRAIVPLLASRTRYVARAAELKTNRAQVVDPARIEDVVAKARSMAVDNGMPPEVADRIYRAMIDAFIAFEHARWDVAHEP